MTTPHIQQLLAKRLAAAEESSSSTSARKTSTFGVDRFGRMFGADPSAFSANTQAQVTTHDTGPAGDLNVRTKPGTSNPKVGAIPHGAIVNVLSGAQSGAGAAGWVEVSFGSVRGFAATDFLTPTAGGGSPNGAPPVPAGQLDPNLHGPFPVRAIVSTKDSGPAGNLNMHASASTVAKTVAQVGHGQVVNVLSGPTPGPGSAGWFNINSNGATTGFAAGEFLRAVGAPVQPGPSPPKPSPPAPGPSPNPPPKPPAPAPEAGPNVPLIIGALAAAGTLAAGGYYLTQKKKGK